MTARLHIEGPLAADVELRLAGPRAHYLQHVLRLRPGAQVRVFNGEAGEWSAELIGTGRHEARLALVAPLRPPEPEPGPTLHFVPIRRNRLDWLVEKATELGVARLVPLLSERAVARLDNAERLRAIAVEAAEQCGRLSVPAIAAPRPLAAWLASREPVPLLLADTAGDGQPIAHTLDEIGPEPHLLIGPEGGLAPEERMRLLATPAVRPVSLGCRILRAETAALVALAACAIRSPREAVF
jgi:16S rRNA (uracil1498-N3)-methyltransferase